MKLISKIISITIACILSINLLSVPNIQAKQTDSVQKELKGVWISYLEFSSAGVNRMSKMEFQAYVDQMFERVSSMGLNTVIVQIRPGSDAMYASRYFPWSSYASGEQGKAPNYDPTSYMVTAAHNRGLKFYGWINPYRVSSVTTNIKKLSSNNMARKWRESKNFSKRRNVLTYQNQLYYNPSQKDVRTLIVNGVKEVVKNYKVDGIVFDDYFYPNLGNDYKTNFDYVEYKEYIEQCDENGVEPKSIINWRKSNVNALLKRTKTAIKAIDSKVAFGVSPQGNISNVTSVNANYCDIKRWMNGTAYMDFICPQIYWSTTNSVSPYEKVVKQWIQLGDTAKVKLYIGIAVYKAGLTKKEAQALVPADLRWYNEKTNLKEQVMLARNTKQVTGFMFYRYDNMVSSKAKDEMKNLQSVLK